ncbi:MAG: mobile mystery protein A [Actinomycetota bacterium]|nr:MAG: HTH-Family Transcriptional [Actinomycetota bacterium]MDO8950208.1 mobile mystery protein A [Actinomycetota bacterium]MDP3631231.1 mobile mystery protein A [Actinomycetota bacterium]
MATPVESKRAREALDQRLVPLGPSSRYAPPRLGWVRAIRDALGMTAADLAARMGVTSPAVRSLEKNETDGGVRLSTLRRAAEAMDCALVYAFIPNSTLQQTVETQAASILEEQLKRVHQTMALEAQEGEVLPASVKAQLEEVTASGRLWSGAATR